MKLPRVLVVVIGFIVLLAALGCSTNTPVEVAPTPNIDATVEARVKQEIAAQPSATNSPEPTPNVDATVEARAKELVAEQPTATPYPTYTPLPTAAPPPKPTDMPTRVVALTTTPEAIAKVIPTPIPTTYPKNKPMPVATPTSVHTPTPTPVPTPTPTPVPTPTPTPVPTPTPTPTPVPTPTPTPVPTPTPTPVPTPTPTPVPTPTVVPTQIPTPTPVPVLASVSFELAPNITGTVYGLAEITNQTSELKLISTTITAYDSSGIKLVSKGLAMEVLVPGNSTVFYEVARGFTASDLALIDRWSPDGEITVERPKSLRFVGHSGEYGYFREWEDFEPIGSSNNDIFEIADGWITNKTQKPITVVAMLINHDMKFSYNVLTGGYYPSYPGKTGFTQWGLSFTEVPAMSKIETSMDFGALGYTNYEAEYRWFYGHY